MKRTYVLVTLAAVLLSVELSSAVSFLFMLGNRADNCAYELWNFRYTSGASVLPARNCIQAGRVNQEPASSPLILVPVQGTVSAIIPSPYTVTIVGNGFDRLGLGFQFCLGLPTNDPARYCTGGAGGFGCDPTVLPATGTVVSSQLITFPMPLAGAGAWNQATMEFDPAPRPVCYSPAGATPRGPFTTSGGVEFPANTGIATTPFIWTGFNIGTVWNCSAINQCNARLTTSSLAGLSTIQQSLISAATVCCQSNNNAWLGGQVGVCLNPNLQTCCGGTPVTIGTEKCCNVAQSTTAFVGGACRCELSTDCADPNGRETSCCQASKYPTGYPTPVTVPFTDPLSTQWGQCYDPNSLQCCNTGYRFDPATHVCCPINGLQSNTIPCPCQLDTDCPFGSGSSASQRCCAREAPLPTGSTCNIYANYPFGNAPTQDQRCDGVCINRAWQICCNGVPCVRNYENCCNDTCCNKFTGSCLFARRAGTAGFAFNNIEQAVTYEQCSLVEHLDTVKAYLLFALPATLLLSSLSVLALALVFANKSSARVFSLLERVLIACAVLSIFLAFPVFFSHLYKYAEVVVFASIVSIFTASVRVRWLNIFCIAVLAITVIYIFDPFYGNAFLTLAYQRYYTGTQLFSSPQNDPDFFIHGRQDPATSGLFHTTAQLFFNSQQTLEVQACTTFYDYFILDSALLDIGRLDNPEIVTFGYCSRAYVIALLYFEAFVALFVLLQFVLAMLALIVRFRKTRFDPIELEVRQIMLDE